LAKRERKNGKGESEEVQKYQLLPPLMQEEYEALKADIAERGVLVPVEYDEDGNILDGHHRVRACKELGIKEWPRLIRVGLNEDEKAEHVLKLNVHRRHLPKEWKQEKAKELKEQGWSNPRIAGVLGVDQATIWRWLKNSGFANAKPENSDSLPKIVTGKDGKQYPSEKPKKKKKNKTIFVSEETAKKAQELPEKYKEAVLLGEKKLIEAKREATKERISKEVELPKDKYRVIYADPPWQYSNSGFTTSAESQYPTMSTEEICKLPIKDLADENAVLFLWVTNPLLEDALKVCEAWGFKYKTNFVWVKNQHTGGFYCYGQHELLFVAVRGSLLPKQEGIHSSVINAPRREHSRKPDEVYSIIEAMYDGPYIELFARSKREGWVGWGIDYGIFQATG